MLLIRPQGYVQQCHVPISHDASTANSSDRDIISPKRQHKVQSDDFEWDQDRLVEEEVPASHESEGVVYPVASMTDETCADRHVCSHFSHAVVDEAYDARVEDPCYE